MARRLSILAVALTIGAVFSFVLLGVPSESMLVALGSILALAAADAIGTRRK